MIENIASFLRELKVGARSLARAKGLTATVVLTLALGIGANAVMFSLVRGVLLRPLVNRDEDRLIYIRQRATGDGNTTFSVPEIADLVLRVKTLSSFGDFSTIGFTMVGLGEPGEVKAGVVGGSYFQVMGLRPVRDSGAANAVSCLRQLPQRLRQPVVNGVIPQPRRAHFTVLIRALLVREPDQFLRAA